MTTLATLPDQDAINAFRQSAAANGFQPLAIVDGTKRPVERQWQNVTWVARAKRGASGTGIKCAGLRFIDVDIDDADAAPTVRSIMAELAMNGPTRGRSNSARFAVLLAAPSGMSPGKRVIKLGTLGNIEVMGKGQQVLVHGLHVSGVPYEWQGGCPATVRRDELPIVEENQIEEFERRVLAAFDIRPMQVPLHPPLPRRISAGNSGTHPYVASALEREVAAVADAGEGGRNDQLNRSAFALGRYVGAGHLQESEVVPILRTDWRRC